MVSFRLSSTKKKRPAVEAKKDEAEATQPDEKQEAQEQPSTSKDEPQPASSTEPKPEVDGQDPDSERPESFEKKLVEMLEVLKNEKDEFPDDDDNNDEVRKR